MSDEKLNIFTHDLTLLLVQLKVDFKTPAQTKLYLNKIHLFKRNIPTYGTPEKHDSSLAQDCSYNDTVISPRLDWPITTRQEQLKREKYSK